MEKYLKNFQCLNQNNYGEDNDCSLTSITACIYYLNKNKYSIKDIYLTVEKIASKYGYTGIKGTSPLKNLILNYLIIKFKIEASI